MISDFATDLNIQFADFLDAQKIVFSCMLGGIYWIDLRNSEKINQISAPFSAALVESSITIDPENKAAAILAELQSPTITEKPARSAPKRTKLDDFGSKAKMVQSPLAKYSSSAQKNRIELESEEIIELSKPETTKNDKILKQQNFILDEKENQIQNFEEITKNEPFSQNNAEIGKISGLLETLVSKMSNMDEKMSKMAEKMSKMYDKMTTMEKEIKELKQPIK
jgi:hypothetical protein